MFDKPFTFKLLTPERLVFAGDVVSVAAPGIEGGFQVLKNHAALLTALDIGRIRVRKPAGAETVFATSGGFVEVRGNVVSLLAEAAETPEEIDVARAEGARDRALQRLHAADENLDVDRARAALARAINRLNVAQAR